MLQLIQENKESIIQIYFIIYLIMSFISLSFYVIDKIKAIHGHYRIPEKVLLALPWFFGSLGGLLGMYAIRHKTRSEHWYFAVSNFLALIIHVALLIMLLTI